MPCAGRASAPQAAPFLWHAQRFSELKGTIQLLSPVPTMQAHRKLRHFCGMHGDILKYKAETQITGIEYGSTMATRQANCTVQSNEEDQSVLLVKQILLQSAVFTWNHWFLTGS
ncbi:hypothetical protein MRB53_014216 [Persea americana]|uniref:Uncharacterized protein n=1 Tax=Persea americana TaxID=3435 RepID=A0ACC2KA90_PERAE|nr:hypothetical protein MRB53_014216 [Persea americana]